jgi:hypothetical protein
MVATCAKASSPPRTTMCCKIEESMCEGKELKEVGEDVEIT